MRTVDGFDENKNTTSSRRRRQKYFDQEIEDDEDQLLEQNSNNTSSTNNRQNNGGGNNGVTISTAAISFIRSLRHRFHKMLVFALIIYPLYIIRRWSERYTEKQTNQRQQKRCEAIIQSTEEYSNWKEAATILDAFAGYSEWKKYQEEDDEDNNNNTDNKLKLSSSSSSSMVSWILPSALVSYFNKNNKMMKKKKGNNSSSGSYNEDKIAESAEFVDRILETNSELAMGTYIRTSLGREMFGLGCTDLHKYYVGSKDSVEHYLSSVEKVIEKFVSEKQTSNNNDDDDEKKSSKSTSPSTNENENEEDDDDQNGAVINRAPEGTDDLKVGPHHLELLRWAKQDDAAAETEAHHNNKSNKTSPKSSNTTSPKGVFMRF